MTTWDKNTVDFLIVSMGFKQNSSDGHFDRSHLLQDTFQRTKIEPINRCHQSVIISIPQLEEWFFAWVRDRNWGLLSGEVWG